MVIKMLNTSDDVLEKLAALRQSVNQHGSSNAVVEKLCTAIINDQITIMASINHINRRLNNVMEQHGLTEGL